MTITARAPTQARADDIAASTVIEESKHEHDYELRTVWPHAMRRRSELRCKDCRITAQYDVIKNVQLFARIENALNQSYEEPEGFQAPYMQAFFGVKARF